MSKPQQPLAEVFGFPTDDFSERAKRYRKDRLCPFHNLVPSCTKASVDNPLGVCSISSANNPIIVCPVRFREDWLIASDAAEFFFPKDVNWTSLSEVRLKDKFGKSAGNIDVVLVAYDNQGRLVDYGALEIQAVYISGNIRTPFRHYMDDPENRANMDWSKNSKYPRADYLSSSRKRLAPQLIYKGGILHAWNRKSAVAMDKGFYQTLPKLESVPKESAEMAWFVYDLIRESQGQVYNLKLEEVIYTKFESALLQITRTEPGDEAEFVSRLQSHLDKKLENKTPSEVGTIDSPFK